MPRILMTESPIGSYNRADTVVVTKADGSQHFASRITKYGTQIAPLNWWRTLGFSKDEREQWAGITDHPEHAKLLTAAGLTPQSIGFRVSETRLGDICRWYGVFLAHRLPSRGAREIHFDDFMSRVSAVGSSANTHKPTDVGEYIALLDGTRVSPSLFSYMIGSRRWLETLRTILLENTAEYVRPRSLAALTEGCRLLMQVGCAPHAATVLFSGGARWHGSAPLRSAIEGMFLGGRLDHSTESYERTRTLAEILAATPFHQGELRELFLTEGTDTALMHRLVTADGITDPYRLRSVLEDHTPLSLIGGLL